MAFPLLSTGVQRSSNVIELPAITQIVVVTPELDWGSHRVNRWDVTTPKVVVWRQMYGTERPGSGGGSGPSAPPEWGQHWPRAK